MDEFTKKKGNSKMTKRENDESTQEAGTAKSKAKRLKVYEVACIMDGAGDSERSVSYFGSKRKALMSHWGATECADVLTSVVAAYRIPVTKAALLGLLKSTAEGDGIPHEYFVKALAIYGDGGLGDKAGPSAGEHAAFAEDVVQLLKTVERTGEIDLEDVRSAADRRVTGGRADGFAVQVVQLLKTAEQADASAD